jgi:dihydropteroate synthase
MTAAHSSALVCGRYRLSLDRPLVMGVLNITPDSFADGGVFLDIRDVDDRMAGSVAAALAAITRGASIVRVHDVRETVDALKVWRAVQVE